MANRKIMLEAPLMKQGHMVKSWKLRMMTLTDDGLIQWAQYDKKSGKKGDHINSINVSGGSMKVVDGDKLELKSKSGKVLLLKGPDGETMGIDKWITAIRPYVASVGNAHGNKHISMAASEPSYETPEKAKQQKKASSRPMSEAVISSKPGDTKPSKIFLKIFVDSKFVREANLGDQHLVKSIAVDRDASGAVLMGALAKKLRVEPDKFESYRIFLPDVLVWMGLEERVDSFQVDNGSKVFVLHETTNPDDATERFSNTERVHISRQGYLQKQGQVRRNWKVRYFVLANDGMIRYFMDDQKEQELGFVYVKGCKLSRNGGEINVESVTSRTICLMGADGTTAMELDAWYSDLERFSKQVPSSAVTKSLTAIEKEESSITDEIGPLVRIHGETTEGIDLGYLMARADGHFSFYKIDAGNSNSKAFLFRRWRKTKYRANGERAWEVHGFCNIKLGKFMSRSHYSAKLKTTLNFSDHETLDVGEKVWRIHSNGMQTPEPLCISIKDPEKLLRYGGKHGQVACSVEEVNEYDDKGNVKVVGWTKASSTHISAGATLVDETQKSWDALATYLIDKKMKTIKTLPHEISCQADNLKCPSLPGLLVRIRVLKRFNSRKLPHLLEFTDDKGNEIKYIFKQDDDLSMDVAVMTLLNLANLAWEKNESPARLNTYTVMATTQCSGFCECISGDTMLKFGAEELDQALGQSVEKWTMFFQSIVAVIVTTAAFDITDRHHNNVMFDPEVGNVALIDLSASLGLKAPMDSTLSINPVYFPDRFLKLRGYYINRCSDGDFRKETSEALDLTDWYQLEYMCMQAYYAVYCDPNIRAFADQFDYEMPTPKKFLGYLTERKEEGKGRGKEALRNNIVTKMEESEAITRVVAAITSALPMN
eukprot:CAMPEP_0119118490 /NCGR_PEP_ID=MMETSP1310-20130426/349_1 /TAXON_ID=464262 /ORGANISM="Genus nov. species nov., Strain RCC2339" /LENGTH=882 /DNA_ID=CAMNT_0007107857 /DNA_START=66 /DNA_END=2714 /DNA_ORIENTATION=-